MKHRTVYIGILFLLLAFSGYAQDGLHFGTIQKVEGYADRSNPIPLQKKLLTKHLPVSLLSWNPAFILAPP